MCKDIIWSHDRNRHFRACARRRKWRPCDDCGCGLAVVFLNVGLFIHTTEYPLSFSCVEHLCSDARWIMTKFSNYFPAQVRLIGLGSDAFEIKISLIGSFIFCFTEVIKNCIRVSILHIGHVNKELTSSRSCYQRIPLAQTYFLPFGNIEFLRGINKLLRPLTFLNAPTSANIILGNDYVRRLNDSFMVPHLSRLIFSRFFYFRGNLGNVKEKPTRKTCFSRETKRLAPRIYLAKFC